MQFGKIAKIVAGTLGLLATVFAIIQGFRDSRPPVPRLQAAVVNIEHVSSRTEIPDVKISLAFKDQSVSDLWLCRVRFQNIGDITLYSTGSRPNTQSPVVISIPEDYEILKIEEKGIDPKDSGFEAEIRQKKNDKGVSDKHQLEITFEQWRKGEAIEAVLYLAGSGEHLNRPKLIPKGRPILDGDVVPVDLSTATAPEVRGSLKSLDRFVGPHWASRLRWFAIAVMGVLGPMMIIARVPSEDWHRNYPTLSGLLKTVILLVLYIAMFAMTD
jgi:hypothetical protein